MKRPSAVVVLVLAGVVGLLGLLAYGVASQDADSSIDDAISRGEREPAPAITLPQLTEPGEKSLEDWRGQVVVLNYWASWCEPCRDESPLLERWHRKLRKHDATVLGVNVLDVTSDATDFIADYDLTYPHLRDKDGESQEKFGVVGYPETFVIDRDGNVAASRTGPVDERFMREKVAPLLKEN